MQPSGEADSRRGAGAQRGNGHERRFAKEAANHVKRVAGILTIIELIAIVALGAITLALLGRTVFSDKLEYSVGPTVLITVNGSQPADAVYVDVHQEADIDGELSVAFSFSAIQQVRKNNAPLQAEVTFFNNTNTDVRCGGPQRTDSHRLDSIGHDDISLDTARTIEELSDENAGSPYQYIDSSDADAARDDFWSGHHLYRFTTEVGYAVDRHTEQAYGDRIGFMPTRKAVDTRAELGEQRPTTPSAGNTPTNRTSVPKDFYCTVSAGDIWSRTRDRGYFAFAPLRVLLLDDPDPTPSPHVPDVLNARTSIKRDLGYTSSQKPDAATSNLGSWRYDAPVVKTPSRSIAPSDYFVFEKINHSRRKEQYSFWVGLSLPFLTAALIDVSKNAARRLSGRASVFDPQNDR